MTIVVTYRTKKRLKECKGEPLSYRETSIFGPEYKADGTFSVVGPGEYERKYYARVTMEGGRIKKVA